MSIVTIVGAGMMGSAIGIPASENGNEVRLVGTPLDKTIIEEAKSSSRHSTMNRTLPSAYKYYQFEELDIALENCDLIVSGVSSFGVDWFAQNVLARISNSIPILAVTKGMHLEDDGTLITFPAYYQKLFPDRDFSINAVGGPCTSYELADHDQTEVCFCGEDPILLAGMRRIFETKYYHVSTSTDVTGVELAVAMKNAYALAVCMAVGASQKRNDDKHENYNSQAALFGQGIKEIRRLLAIYGGGEENIVYAAGDMYVTIFGGRTRKIGILLGQGMSIRDAQQELAGVTLESLVIATRTALAVRKMIQDGKAGESDFPLMLYMDDIINRGQTREIPWDSFETHAS